MSYPSCPQNWVAALGTKRNSELEEKSWLCFFWCSWGAAWNTKKMYIECNLLFFCVCTFENIRQTKYPSAFWGVKKKEKEKWNKSLCGYVCGGKRVLVALVGCCLVACRGKKREGKKKKCRRNEGGAQRRPMAAELREQATIITMFRLHSKINSNHRKRKKNWIFFKVHNNKWIKYYLHINKFICLLLEQCLFVSFF